MKRLVVAIAAVAGLAMTTGIDNALAQRGGGHSGGHGGGHYSGHYGGGHYGGKHYHGGWYGGAYWPWYWGFAWTWPGWYGGYYGYPYYAYPYPNEVEPPVYGEMGPPAAPQTLWYYCTDPAGYYPYVQNCNVPWMQVQPTR